MTEHEAWLIAELERVRQRADALECSLQAVIDAIMNEHGGADILPVHPDSDRENWEVIQKARVLIDENSEAY